MREFSIISVTIIILLVAIAYIRLLIKHKIKPALAMWIFFTIAVSMSLITYLSESNYSFLDNIVNSIDLIYVSTVSAAIIIFGDKSSKFTRFDKGCLVVVIIIIIFWLFTRNHFVTNILIQVIMVISYFPVIKRFIDSKENTESLIVWSGMLLAPALSLLSSQGLLATIYAVRAIVCTGLLVLLMLRIEYLNKKRQDKNTTEVQRTRSSTE